MDISGIALSALSAYEKKLNVTANNIANLNTADFHPSEAMINDNSQSGVYVTITSNNSSEVDLTKEMVDMITTANGFKANLKTLETAFEMTESLLDIKI
jgi:flagellar hook protein FlgE